MLARWYTSVAKPRNKTFGWARRGFEELVGDFWKRRPCRRMAARPVDGGLPRLVLEGPARR